MEYRSDVRIVTTKKGYDTLKQNEQEEGYIPYPMIIRCFGDKDMKNELGYIDLEKEDISI